MGTMTKVLAHLKYLKMKLFTSESHKENSDAIGEMMDSAHIDVNKTDKLVTTAAKVNASFDEYLLAGFMYGLLIRQITEEEVIAIAIATNRWRSDAEIKEFKKKVDTIFSVC